MLPQNKLPSTKVSVFVTLGLVVLVGALALFGISVVMRGISESAPAPAFVAGAAPTQSVETETPIPPTETNDATPTPLVIMGVPNDVTPPPTYAVGPTAQFTELLPTSEWLTYEDKEAGFSVKYPPDWYLVASPEQERVAGYNVSVHSYDPQDMTLSVLRKSGKWPSNFIKVEIALMVSELTGQTLASNENISDWVHRTYPMAEEERVISENSTEIGGRKAFEQITQPNNGTAWSATYLPVGKYIMVVGRPHAEEDTIASRITRTIIDSIQFTK